MANADVLELVSYLLGSFLIGFGAGFFMATLVKTYNNI
jgi:hypothetical protein